MHVVSRRHIAYYFELSSAEQSAIWELVNRVQERLASRAPGLDRSVSRVCREGRQVVRPVVDHFLPWSRHPDNGIEKLVPADTGCNAAKRDFLASTEHVEHWTARLSPDDATSEQLREIEDTLAWESHPMRTLSVARAVYLCLPLDFRLWSREKEFHTVDRDQLLASLIGA